MSRFTICVDVSIVLMINLQKSFWITLSEANLPSHRHFVVSNDLGGQNRTNSNVSANNQVRKGTGAGNLYESYNLASTGSEAASGRSSAVGSGTAINNKPLYHALCYIMKT